MYFILLPLLMYLGYILGVLAKCSDAYRKGVEDSIGVVDKTAVKIDGTPYSCGPRKWSEAIKNELLTKERN